MAFTQIRKQKAYIQIAEQIVDAIRQEEYAPGDKLPSLRELEMRFGVSRPTIREALSALELAGIVGTRMGQGTFVIGLQHEPREGSWFELDQGESPAEVLEARLILEPAGAALAAERAQPADIENIRATLDTLKGLVAAMKPAIAGDIQFHVAVAKASGNSVIYEVVRGVANYLSEALWRSLRERAWAHRDLGKIYIAHHEHTLEAIEGRDSQAAAESMRVHLKHVEEDLFSPEPPEQGPTE